MYMDEMTGSQKSAIITVEYKYPAEKLVSIQWEVHTVYKIGDTTINCSKTLCYNCVPYVT